MELGEEMVTPLLEKVGSMTVGPIPGQTPMSAGPALLHTRVARWAVGLAEAGAAMALIALAGYGVAYVVGGSSAVEDNWLAILVVASFFTGILTSAIAFVLAVAVRVKRERWTLLWLPLSVFPALLAFLVLGEAFWWE
jgi:hypothetical protein